MKTIFVAGTDTGVGKTFFCAHFLKYLLDRDIVAGYQKWVSTGDAEHPADLDFCIQIAGPKAHAGDIDLQVPFRFPFPASPHLAAEIAGRELNAEVIVSAFRSMTKKYELLIVEGVGGLLVPLRRDLLLIDLLARVRPPVLLVARSGLGTLNHTLLSLEALHRRDIPVIGVVFSDPPDPGDEVLINDNMKTIAELGATRVFGRLYRTADHGESRTVREIFAAIGRAIPENFQHE
jgi:dethiobiotin synthetase